MNEDKIDYILKYYSKLMNEKEANAWKHWSVNYKVEHSNMTPEQNAARLKFLVERKWLSSDDEVLSLLKDGIEDFKKNTAIRIAQDHPEVLQLNNCPKCGKLARTPFAKQCRFCSNDWH